MGDIEEGSSPDSHDKISTATTAETIESSSLNDVPGVHADTLLRMSFVDYVAPPRPVPPPAKYKLWFIVIFLVFFTGWFTSEAGFLPWLQNTFGLSVNGALFFVFGSVVGCLVYAGLDLLMFCCRIKIRGEWYGLEAWLKRPRIQWVHEYQNCVVIFIAKILRIFEDGFALFNVPKPEDTLEKQFEADEEEQEVVLKIENRIRPDKVNEYKIWTRKLVAQGCLNRPGLKSVQKEIIHDDEKGDLHIIYLTFTSIDVLNEYMTSPVRARFVRNLQPLLMTPSSVQLQKDRVLPDAFTDLCTQQGQEVPTPLPKKWKVWFITTMGLWFVVMITNATLGTHYDEVWNLDNQHVRLQSFVRALFNTFLNSYVMTPFLMMLFGNWMKRDESEYDKLEPWRTLNDGFQTIWGKVVLFLAFYGSCAIAWGVKSRT